MTNSQQSFGGSIRLADGSRRIISEDEAKRLFEQAEASQKARAEKLPDEQAAINAMFEAFDRLRELGWQCAEYCPKDGTRFRVIEAGSTGVFDCTYQGDWPEGSYWIYDGGDIWPSRPILFRLYPEDEAKRKERMAAAIRAFEGISPGVADE
jgi:hypothetical protein